MHRTGAMHAPRFSDCISLGASAPFPSIGVGAVIDVFQNASDALDRSLRHPRLREVAALMQAGRLARAEKLLRDFLDVHPHDAAALQLMAGIAWQRQRREDAELLLAQCLQRKPDFTAARFNHAGILLELNRPEAALAQVNKLLERESKNPIFRRLKADILEAVGDFAGSMEIWREMTHDHPQQAECWVRYGSALRALGSQADAVAAFRKALVLNPKLTVAWIHLADTKTIRFDGSDIEEMETQLSDVQLAAPDRTNLHFSLGKAYADISAFEKSFSHFAKGNALSRINVDHDPDVLTRYVGQCKQVFTADLFQRCAGSECATPGPIFLVGMPRAGSTLVEHILASHSQIEGAGELTDIAVLSQEIQQRASGQGRDFPEVLAILDSTNLLRYGERYVEMSQVHRRLGRRFFVDKMGANFAHVGLIQLILPNARIVDVRRHPMACCFSNFSQLFRKGQNNAYRLTDLGRLYRDYADLMAHFDAVMPGRVHRILYENLVAEPETEIRRLLQYLGLPFEDSCLYFFRTDRAVATLSSGQVRRPIYRDALEFWRHYEPWLAPLRTALGSAVDDYESGLLQQQNR